MDLPQLSVSPAQIIVGILSAAIAFAGSYWVYQRTKRDKETRWRIENIYESGLEEVNAVIEEEEFPGSPRNRQDASFWDNISYTEKLRLGPTRMSKGNQYYHLLEDLEKAERKFISLNGKITSQFPDDVIKNQETSVQLLAGGTVNPAGNDPSDGKVGILQSWVSLGSIVEDHLPEILDVGTQEELRELLLPEEGLEEHQYPDRPTFFMGSGLQPEQLSFLDEEFPEWVDSLYVLIEEGYLEDYLRARQQQHDIKEELKDAAQEVRRLAEKDIESLNTD
ncbi:hypothetical protein JMJ58_12805 [Haloterrigena salifodinae]|uniref:Uncharacterized protein n=1 Tax=Haloterrigena salifodinae TaxID=2675099 RepID=A0A8T8DX27_9EURY|nr:hypothetical protein [Haloterrigena salifodinae]QRV13831.1 hypothetical protein JMJ58_12805 [Haloterrigena salifodinae]